jgi:hypothetical protein
LCYTFAAVKTTVILCVIAVGFLAQPSKAPKDNKADTTDHAPNTITVVNNEEPRADTPTPEHGIHRVYAALKRPDWWLVIVAAITAAFICWQARETAGATRAMRDSIPHQEQAAKAALFNAQAVVNAERAWIIPELKCLNVERDGRWFKSDDAGFNHEETIRLDHLQYVLKVANMGRTPAIITSFQINYTLLPAGETDLPLNAGGDLSERREPNQFIAAGESTEMPEPVIKVSEYTKGHLLKLLAEEETAVFHGWVAYKHMFSQIEDRADFCYVLSARFRRLASDARHTKHTQQTKDEPHT